VQVANAAWAFTVPVFALSPLQSDTVHVVVPEQNGRPVENRWLTWGTSDPDIVTVSPLGVVTAISAGQAEIGASGLRQELRLPVRVHRAVESFLVSPRVADTVIVPLGGDRRIAALPEAADETIVADAPVNWIVGDTAVLSYSVTDTVATGKAIGSTTLTAAAAGGLDVTWNIKVVAAGLALDRDRLGMSLDDQVVLSPFFADTAGDPLSPATDVTWSSTNEAVLQVSSTGTLTPITRGRSQIIARTPWGVADTAAVFVQGEILVTSTRNGQADLFAFDPGDPGVFTPITEGPGDEIGSAYSPDGSRIVYASNRDGNYELYVVDADGQNSQRLTMTTANEGEPSWTPDGTEIVYQSDASGGLQVWIMDADGSNQRALTEGTAANLEPTVSPDGSRILFTSVRDENYEIYVMGVDGSNQRNLTQAANSHERAPAWLGDTAIVYVREEREDRSSTWVVVKHSLTGGTQDLTQPTLVVTDFAISSNGDLLAVTTQSPSPTGGAARRLYLIPLDGQPPVEVPRSGEHDQLVRPAFRP
jgi:Tol biopolymer transport system component